MPWQSASGAVKLVQTQHNRMQCRCNLGRFVSGAMYWKSLKHLKTLLNNTPISYAPYDPYVHSVSPPHVCCRYSPLVFSCTLFCEIGRWSVSAYWGCSQGACLPPPIVLCHVIPESTRSLNLDNKNKRDSNALRVSPQS